MNTKRILLAFAAMLMAQLAVLPGSDHFLLWSNPQKALSLLTPFLADAAPEKPLR